MEEQELTKTIFPEYERLKGLSPFIEDEDSILISLSDYAQLESIIKDNDVEDKIDNLGYILIVLKQVVSSIKVRKMVKANYRKFNNDRLEVAKFLKLCKDNNNITIAKVKFDISKKTDYNSDLMEYKLEKQDTFTIEGAEIISQILSVILNKYHYKTSAQDDLEDIIKKQERYRKPNILAKSMAHNVYKYLTNNTSLGENKKYILIGRLFQLSGIETELSIDHFIEINNTVSYKNFQDYLKQKIVGKYFKVEEKPPKNK